MAEDTIKKRNFSKQQAVVCAFGTNQAAIALLMQWIVSENTVDNVKVLAFDADGTREYPNLPRPTNEDFLQVDFQAGTFQILQTPGPNTIAGITSGQYPGKTGFGSINEFAHGNGGTKGTGGSPLCGRITAIFNRESILSSIEKVLRDILEQRHHDADDDDYDILIYALFSEYGGCASGMREEVLILMEELVKRTVKNASLYQVIIIPGIDKPKDLLQAGSIAFAGLAEIAAAATGRFYSLRQYETDTEPKVYRVPHVRTMILSNFNNAQGKPIALDRTRQTSLIARFLEYQVTSAIGKRVDGELLDFDDDARSQTAKGEFRGVKAIGMSMINLERPRLLKFATTSIVVRACDALLQDLPQHEFQNLAEQFFRENRLLEGEGFTMLSTSLLISHNGVGRINLAERAQGVILSSLNAQKGVQAVNAAVSAVEVAQDIVATCQDQIRNGVEERLSNLCQTIDERYNAICRNYNLGVSAGLKWLSTVDLMMDRLKGVVSESLRDTHEVLTHHQAVVNNFRDRIAPAVLGSGFLTQLFNRERFREIARQGIVAIANKSSVELRYLAVQQAIEVLNQLHEHVKTRLAQATEILNIVEAFRVMKMKEREYLLNLDDSYVCPNGHALINKETIQNYYERILNSMDNSKINQVETELANQSLNLLHQRLDSFLGLLDNTEILEVLQEIASERFKTQVNMMSVADELLRLKPIDSNALRAYLLEREREAMPMLRLKDNDRHDNPAHYVRLIGIAGGDSHALVRELNSHSLELRDKPYMGVDTGDPDNIVLVTIRSSIPVSCIENYSNYEAAYQETARNLKEEKYHRAIWRRLMPLPGEKIGLAETRRYLTMGLIAQRLDIQIRGSVRNVLLREYDLHNPNNPQSKTLILGSSIRDIRATLQGRFDLLVEIWSLFWEVWFQQNGPEKIEAELLKLDQTIGNHTPNDLTTLVSSMVDHETIQQLLSDLDWVKDQVTPSAMFYYKR